MKKSIFISGFKTVVILFSFLLISLYACKKKSVTEEGINNSKFIAEKTSVQTFEVIRLSSKAKFLDKYNARFGTATVPLLKITDSTLAFIVPDVTSGEYILRFDSAAIKFTVVKTQQINSDQLVSTAFKNFDTYLSSLPTTTALDTIHVESMKANKAKVISMYNSLTSEQKRLTGLFYEANKDLFKPFEDQVSNALNADIRLKPSQISECPKTNFKDYGICISEVLYHLLYVLNTVLDDALITIENNGEYTDYEIPFASALYIRFFEKQKIFAFRYNVESYMHMNWVFDDRLFDNITTIYPDEEFIDLNINAGFRPLDPGTDGSMSSDISNFFEQMELLKPKWERLPFLGYFPSYQTSFDPITLNSSDITISQISNNNVILGDKDGETIKFNAKSDQQEYFSYQIQARRQGFFSVKTVYGKVEAVSELEKYKASIVGNWRIDSYDPNGVLYYVQHKTLTADGSVYIRINKPVGGPEEVFNPPRYQERWGVVKNSTGYHLTINSGVYPYVLNLPVTFINGGWPPYPVYAYTKE